METPAHWGFIATAYGATMLAMAGLILRAVLDHHAQRRALAELETSGLTRRSDAARRPFPASEAGSRV